MATKKKGSLPARAVDWVQQDTTQDTILWRQGKREQGDYPVLYTDRRSDYRMQQETKPATKKAAAVVEVVPRYSDAEQKKMSAVFKPLVTMLQKRYGEVRFWHFDHPTGTLIYSAGGNNQVRATANDVIKVADDAFQKFTDLLSTLHDKDIVPAR